MAFMATDNHCKNKEKNALRFFVFLGMLLTAIGIWNFDIELIKQVSLHDWSLLGLFPFTLIYLKQKTHLIKIQSMEQGREVSLSELELGTIKDKALVQRYKRINVIMWSYACIVLFLHLWSQSGNSI